MKTLYIDSFCGFNTNMFLSALCDMECAKKLLADIKIPGFSYVTDTVNKRGIDACRVRVSENSKITPDNAEEFADSLELHSKTKRLIKVVLKNYEYICKRFGIHTDAFPPCDTLFDIAASLEILQRLEIGYIYSLGVGDGSGTSDGKPVPSPENMEIYKAYKIPVRFVNEEKELVSLLGNVFMSTIVHEFGLVNNINILHIGYGAGDFDTDTPNVLRLVIGETGIGDNQNILFESLDAELSGAFGGYSMK